MRQSADVRIIAIQHDKHLDSTKTFELLWHNQINDSYNQKSLLNILSFSFLWLSTER